MNELNIGARLKELRKNKKYTQKEISAKSGVSRSYYADIENGRYSPSLETLKKISNALDVPLSCLLDESFPLINDIEKNNVFLQLEQYAKMLPEKQTKKAFHYSLEFLSNCKEYDELEVETINNLYELLFTLRNSNEKLSKNTKNFIKFLLRNLSLEIEKDGQADFNEVSKLTLQNIEHPKYRK